MKHYPLPWLSCGAVLLTLFPSTRLPGESPAVDRPTAAADSGFIRLQRDAEGEPRALQTARRRYARTNRQGKLTVDLIGAVHIGDKPYYDQLNELFKQYDVLLYELVAPKGTRIPQGGRDEADNPFSMMQRMAQTVLGLESQTDHVDYTAKNFVHADMSPADMAAAMRERGETPLSFALNAAGDVLRQASLRAQEMEKRRQADGADDELDLFSLLSDAQGSHKLKRQMAEEFGTLGSPEGPLGATINQALIADRNAAAMKVLRRQVTAGHRRIAIFYGAAHMSDFAKRLNRDLGLKRTETEWLTAWDLTPAATADSRSPLRLIWQMIETK